AAESLRAARWAAALWPERSLWLSARRHAAAGRLRHFAQLKAAQTWRDRGGDAARSGDHPEPDQPSGTGRGQVRGAGGARLRNADSAKSNERDSEPGGAPP